MRSNPGSPHRAARGPDTGISPASSDVGELTGVCESGALQTRGSPRRRLRFGSRPGEQARPCVAWSHSRAASPPAPSPPDGGPLGGRGASLSVQVPRPHQRLSQCRVGSGAGVSPTVRVVAAEGGGREGPRDWLLAHTCACLRGLKMRVRNGKAKKGCGCAEGMSDPGPGWLRGRGAGSYSPLLLLARELFWVPLATQLWTTLPSLPCSTWPGPVVRF